MAKTTSVFARVEPQVKQDAEAVLNQLGIPISNAIGMFLKQVALQRGIPFEMKLPNDKPLAVKALTQEQLYAELNKGVKDLEAGNVISGDDLISNFRDTYGI